MKMKAVFRLIGPKEAGALLEKHNDSNRKLRTAYVKQLASEMEHGRWQQTHQAIGLNGRGQLVDGQHRLAAVCLSRKPQRFLVVSGVPKEALSVIDCHAHRKTRDSLRIVHGMDVTDRAVSCAMYIESQGESVRRLPAERMEIYLKHHKLVSRTEKIFSTSLTGVCRGNVMSVVARALHSHPTSEIEPFCKLLITGESSKPWDSIGIKLRDYLMLKVSGQGKGVMHVSSYKRTEYALSAWLRREKGVQLKEASEELFPLPGERRRGKALRAPLPDPLPSAPPVRVKEKGKRREGRVTT